MQSIGAGGSNGSLGAVTRGHRRGATLYR
jgi:hypothetical protein